MIIEETVKNTTKNKITHSCQIVLPLHSTLHLLSAVPDNNLLKISGALVLVCLPHGGRWGVHQGRRASYFVMTPNEISTMSQRLSEARRQWNYPAESGNTEDTLLLVKYINRVCACAMRCEEMNDDDRDAVNLLLSKSTILCDIISFSDKK